MKKVIALAALLMAGTVHAGFFDNAMTNDYPTVDSTAKYKVEVYGYNVRVHEWIPEGNPNVRCMLVTGNKNSSGVACYPAAQENGQR